MEDDDTTGREQARLLRSAIERAQLGLPEVWVHYFSIGGDAGEFEVDAYLHHAFTLPRVQRDMLAHAVNELVGYKAEYLAPYASDLFEGDGSPEPPD